MPLVSKPSSTVIRKSYVSAGKGRKEAFRNRKETLFRKTEEIGSTGAFALCLLYQPHLSKWHLYKSSKSPDDIWPMDIADFIHGQDVSISVFEGETEERLVERSLNAIPPLPALEVGSPLSPLAPASGQSSQASTGLSARTIRKTYKPYPFVVTRDKYPEFTKDGAAAASGRSLRSASVGFVEEESASVGSVE